MFYLIYFYLFLVLSVVDENKVALHVPNKKAARHSSAVPLKIDPPLMKIRTKHNSNTVYTKVRLVILHRYSICSNCSRSLIIAPKRVPKLFVFLKIIFHCEFIIVISMNYFGILK